MGIIEFQNKKVVVVGSGLSGIAAAKLLKQVKADVTIFEGNEKATEQEIIGKVQIARSFSLFCLGSVAIGLRNAWVQT